MRGGRANAGLVAVGFVGAGVLLLHRLGSGELATPPLASAEEFGAWVDSRGAVVAAFALLRVLALAAGWYVLAVAALGPAARCAGLRRVAGVIDAVTIPWLRTALGGAGLSALTVLGGLGAAPAGADSPAPRADRLVELTTSPATEPGIASVTTPLTASGAPSAPTMRVLAHDVEVGGAPTTSAPAPAREQLRVDDTSVAAPVMDDGVTAPAPLPPTNTASPVTMRRLPPAPSSIERPDPSAPLDVVETWTIEPGESFWSVARDQVAASAGREPDDREVERYWRTLMAANPEASPTGDPNVLYRGTVLVLPPA